MDKETAELLRRIDNQTKSTWARGATVLAVIGFIWLLLYTAGG